MPAGHENHSFELEKSGDSAAKDSRYAEALDAYLGAASAQEIPSPDLAVKTARTYGHLGRYNEALAQIRYVVDSGGGFTAWQAASKLLDKIARAHDVDAKREVRLAVLGSHTTTQFAQLLQLAAYRLGIRTDLYHGGYAQYRQEIADSSSAFYEHDPEAVVLAVHHGEVQFPPVSPTPDDDLEIELARWTGLWETIRARTSGRIIMHNFALPVEAPMGHLGTRIGGSRYHQIRRLNDRLGEEAGGRASIVDVERLSALIGKRTWFDDRYWHVAKQAVSLESLPLLSLHTAAVLGAELGLSKKCLVVDLDNTLWGGVIGEDGLTGIRLGAGPEGEAFVAFQEFLIELKRKGIILAACSKNNELDAREPFERHPDMRLSLDDFAVFVANWRTKTENLKVIAETLNIGLDSLVFVDDNPAEREIVRQMLPEVEVIRMPDDPSQYTRALAESVWFETSSFTEEDTRKTEQYRARADAVMLEAESSSLEEFHRSLDMEAELEPFDELHLARIVQLIGKTNQFNLTTRRHSAEDVRRFMDDPDSVTLWVKLRDRFTDHGLVSLLIASKDGDCLDIDTWLMSCRVIGRTLEATMLERLSAEAERMGCTKIRGTYVPTSKNAMVAGIYPRFGFRESAEDETTDESKGTSWVYDLDVSGPIPGGVIRVKTTERAHGAA